MADKKKNKENALLEQIGKEIKDMLKAKTDDGKVEDPSSPRLQLLDKAMKFIALQEKINQDDWGEFFDEPGEGEKSVS